MTEFNGIRWAYDRYEVIADAIVNGVGVVFAAAVDVACGVALLFKAVCSS